MRDGVPIKLLNKNKEKTAKGESIVPLYQGMMLMNVCEKYKIPSLAVRREGVVTVIPRANFGKGPTQGGISADEMKAPMQAGFKENHPRLVQSKLEKMFADEDWVVMKGPPYCPQFNESELPWHDGKNFSASEHQTKQSIRSAANNLMDYMFGTAASAKRKKAWPRYGPEQAMQHQHQVDREITAWVQRRGVRLSGEYPNLEYDGSKIYKDDGSVKHAGAFDDEDSDEELGAEYDSE